jgi:hypothetical protein
MNVNDTPFYTLCSRPTKLSDGDRLDSPLLTLLLLLPFSRSFL